MPTILPVLSLSTVGPGTFLLPSTPLPVGISGVTFSIDVSLATDPLPAVTFALEGSLDGGTTWIGAGGAGRAAGSKTIPTRGGGTVTPTEISFTVSASPGQGSLFWSDTTNTNRRIRGSVIVGGSVLIAATVTLLP